METSAFQTAKLTPKGERTRARIVEAATQLIYERGVARTTTEDVRAAAEVSGSQLYHYFADKEALVQAVIVRQTDAVVDQQERADLTTIDGLRAWRDSVLRYAQGTEGRGGCPLGSLGGQLAESDAQARRQVAVGFERWSAALCDGLRTLHAAGQLAPGTDPDALAVTLLAVLQGGLLLAQVGRDIRPLATALDTLLSLAVVAPASKPAG